MCLLIQHHLFLWYHLPIKSLLLPEAFPWIKLQKHTGKKL
jgi:hypothetical protein